MNTLPKNICFIAFLLLSLNLAAQRDTAKEHQIESQLQSVNSSVVDAFKQGTVAMDQGNLELADSLYALVLVKAPNFDPLLRRLGSIRAELGNVYGGIKLCEKAVQTNKSAYNLLSLANCYFHYEGYKDIDKALQLLKEARSLPDGDDISILALLGQIELEKGNAEEFTSITNIMRQKYPTEMITHYYLAIMNANDKKWSEAKSEILLAKQLGLSDEAVRDFLDSGVGSKAARKSYAIGFVWVVIAWAAGLLLLFIIGKVLSNLTLKSIENGLISDRYNRTGNSFRSLYKSLINIGGVYYYISLPIVILLVIALVVALFYVFILAGRIPIKLALFLVIGACITVYAMIRSLLVKVTTTDPGRELKREEAPRLYKLTEEVAKDINTRAIDEIRITPGTDLAVYERGTWKEKLGDKAQRILILGIGVLKDFHINDFKAVLAHEYGHFSNRDTAGGEIALRVMNDMNKYVYALYESGQTVWWNLAFQFLRVYNFIFRRISHGSTRLQEVLADMVAARIYGQLAFQNGLTHVIKRDIEFNYITGKEIEEVKKANRPFNNFYQLSTPTDNIIETALEKALNAPTTDDDTHPSPIDRFRFISKIDTDNLLNDSGPITDLFVNWNNITVEMIKLIESEVGQN